MFFNHKKSLVSILHERAHRYPNKAAYLFLEDGKREGAGMTYQELYARSCAAANKLQNSNLNGQRLLLLYPPGPDFIVAFLGCLFAGVIAVPIALPSFSDVKKSEEILKYIIDNAGIVGVLTTSACKKEIATLIGALFESSVFIVDTSHYENDNNNELSSTKISEDSIAYLQYTSGSTAAPKGVVVRHKNLVYSLMNTARVWHYSKESVTLTWSPHSHVYGLICGLLLPIFHGGLAIVIPTEAFIYNPLCWLEAISKYRVTHSGGPNFGYELCVRMLSKKSLNELNFSHWKMAINGGEKVQHQTLSNFYDLLKMNGFTLNRFCSAYGMSEAIGAIACGLEGIKPTYIDLSLPDLADNHVILGNKNLLTQRIVSSGYFLPGIKSVIVDPETLKAVSPGKIGELWLTGKSLANEYWQDKEATDKIFKAKLQGSAIQYLRTGDLGFLKKNVIYLTGRLKEIFVHNGKKYYLTNLENTITNAISELSLSHKSVVLPLLFENKEEILVVQEIAPEKISTQEQRDVVIKKILAVILEQFGLDLLGVLLVREGAISKNSNGKVQRKSCHHKFLSSFPKIDNDSVIAAYLKIKNPISSIITVEENNIVKNGEHEPLANYLFPQFIQLVSKTLNVDQSSIDLQLSLSAYHVDSIILTQLARAFNVAYGLNLSVAELYGYTTLAGLFEDLINKNQSILDNYYRNIVDVPVSNVTFQPNPVSSNSYQPCLSDPLNIKFNNVAKLDSSGIHDSDIAIIGMDGVFPQSPNLKCFWDNLITGKNVVTEVPDDREMSGLKAPDDGSTKYWGGFIENVREFDANFFNIFPREAELMDPQQRLFLQVVWKTIEDAGYTPETLSKFTTGVFAGIFNSDYAELLHQAGIQDAYVATGTSQSLLANRISYFLNLKGPSITIDTACSSSLVAIHQAVQALQSGDCTLAIAGGVNLLLSATNYFSAHLSGMLSDDGSCKAFDQKANGYVRAEGAAAILLKSYKTALEDGDRIYGVIKGSAVNHGGHMSGLTVPNPNAQAEVIIDAYRRANISVNSISYIEAHGTGTELGDPIEINGLKKAFSVLLEEKQQNQPVGFCGIGTVKTNIGHCESASGMAGVIKVLLAMHYEKIPGNLHFESINPQIDIKNSPFYIVNKNITWDRLKNDDGSSIPRRAGISSFGFGGTNAHILIQEPDITHQPLNPQSTYPYYLLAISAKTVLGLQQRIKDLKNFLIDSHHESSLLSISYMLAVGRKHFQNRCVLIVDSLETFNDSLSALANNIMTENILMTSPTIVVAEKETKLYQPIFRELYKQLIKDLNSSTLAADDYRNKLLALGNFYIEGYEVEWNELYKNNKIKPISLPTYPFSKECYWVPHEEALPSSDEIASTVSAAKQSNLASDPARLIEDDHHHNAVSRLNASFKYHISRLLKIASDQVNVTSSLSEIGFDSIMLKELAVSLEESYGVAINPSLFFSYTTIQSLSEFLVDTFPKNFTLVNDQVKTQVVHNDDLNKLNRFDSHDPIAIIGVQGTFPQSKDLNEFWDNLLSAKDLTCEVPPNRWNWADYYGDSTKDPAKSNSKWGGFIEDVDKFDAEFFNISPREASFMDPQHRLFLETVWKTIEDSGYDPFSFSGKEVGVFVGVEFSEYASLLAENAELHGYIATGTSHALLANRVSYFFDFHGPSEVVDTACSSSLVALHRAVNAIYYGECSVAIAGGVSLNLDPKTFVITSQLGVLSSDGKCKTFDKNANGYVKGEGVVAVLLKSLHQAQKDGDHIYGIIKGTAVKHSGKTQSLTAPNAVMQSELLVQAYRNANISPDTVTYIEAHGTGTELGDPIEIEGLKLAFKKLADLKNISLETMQCGIGSVKTAIGHLEPASGIAGLTKVLLSMQHGKLPANLHFQTLNPYIDLTDSPFYLVNETKTWKRLLDASGKEIPRRAGVSSFGFGGTMAHAVVEEFLPEKVVQETKKPFYLMTLSARNDDSLKQRIIDLHQWLTRASGIDLEALSYTLNKGRTHFPFRIALVVNSCEQLRTELENLKNDQSFLSHNCSIAQAEWPSAETIYRSIVEALQHYQHVTSEIYHQKLMMLRDLYIKQYPILWDDFYAVKRPRRIASLPSYPFIRQRYWFESKLSNEKDQKLTTDQKCSPTAQERPTDEGLNHFTLRYLQNIFAEKLRLPPQKIAFDITYENYGVDSLLGQEITTRLEGDFGSLSKTLLYEKNQLRELALYLQANFKSTLECLYHSQTDSHDIKHAVTPRIMTQPSVKPVLVNSIDRDVAIIGVSGIYPRSETLNEFWLNLSEGRDCITEIPLERWNYQDYPVIVNGIEKYYRYGGFIKDIDKFDPLFFGISPREAEFMDPQERMFMQSAWSTIEDAGYTRKKLSRLANNDVGVFVGVTYNFYPLFIAEEWNKGNRLPLDIQNFSLANRVSYFLNLRGPSFVVDTACSSSLAAIHLAYESVIHNECAMAIAGGVNLSLHPCKYHMLGTYGFMSDEGRCVSFGAGGNGYVPAEGVGSILLKPLTSALQDRDQIYAVIKGSSMKHGGKTSGYTVPNPNAQAALVKEALDKANVSADSISYIEAHGTGTSLGDPIEIRGLQEAFESSTQNKQFCAIGSVKSNIGHLESAAGISQITKVLLQMKFKQLAPSLHAEVLNPYIDFSQTPFFVQRELSEWESSHYPRRAGVSSFGAGGTNVHVILEEFLAQESDEVVETVTKPFLFLLSAFNSERLKVYAQIIFGFLTQEKIKQKSMLEENLWLRNFCYTSQVGRESMEARLAVQFSAYDELINTLQAYLNSNTTPLLWVNSNASNTVEDVSTLTINEYINSCNYEKLAKLWINGVEIPWQDFYDNTSAQMVSYPTYPFAKRHCWIESTEDVNPKVGVSAASVETDQSVVENVALIEVPVGTAIPMSQTNHSNDFLNDWLYQVRWLPKKRDITNLQNRPPIAKEESVLILVDEGSAYLFQDEFKNSTVIYCFSGFEFERRRNNVFFINPSLPSDYLKLFDVVFQEYGISLKKIIYFSMFCGKKRTQISEDLWSACEQSENSLFLLYFFKSILKFQWPNQLQLNYITQGSQLVNEEGGILFWQYHLWSLFRIFAIENHHYQVLLLDLEANKHQHESLKLLLEEITYFNPEENYIVYRNGIRYVQSLIKAEEAVKQITSRIENLDGWTAPKTVLIAGGLGILGQEVMQFLAENGTQNFLILGRTTLPARCDWSSIADNSLKEKVNTILALESIGADVQYFSCDIANKGKVQVIIEKVESHWRRPITGVFYLAGSAPNHLSIEAVTHEGFQTILWNKIKGALTLHELFKKPTLDCFILFSSISALPYFGVNGLSAYATGDAFLDGLAAYRRQKNLRATSVNWVSWNKGIGAQDNHHLFLESVGMSVLKEVEGLQILKYLLLIDSINVSVLKVDWMKFFQINSDAKKMVFFNEFSDQCSNDTTERSFISLGRTQVVQIVTAALSTTLGLGFDEINPSTPYLNYGLDSIMGIKFVEQINRHFPGLVSPMDLYRYPTIIQLSDYIQTQCISDSNLKQSPELYELKTVITDEALMEEISKLDDVQVCQLLEDELID